MRTLYIFTHTLNQNLNYNLTAHQLNRHMAAVSGLQEGFRNAYTQIISSESTYSGLKPLIAASIDNLPSKFSQIESSLDEYGLLVGSIDAEFPLKTQANDLFLSINQSSSLTGKIALNSVQVG